MQQTWSDIMWKDILKNDKEDLEIQLEELVDKWGEELDISDFEYFADRNGPNLSGIEIDVTFEDMYEGEEDLSQEEKLEEDVGYYRIDFRSEKYEEFAVADYTINDGYQVVEFSPERLDVNELKSAIRALGGSVMNDKFIRKKDESIKEAVDKVTEEIRDALSDIDFDMIMRVIMPHGRTKETYKNKEELVEHLTQEAINRIKSDRLYKGDIISKKRSFQSRPSRDDIEEDIRELMNMIEDAIYIVEKMNRAGFKTSSELMELLKRAEFLVNQEIRYR